ncbi:SGNH/GDSL hydrolase family protein [Spirosoma fluminis]
MHYMIRVVNVVLLVFVAGFTQAQTQPRYEPEIQAFEKSDKTTPPPQHPIVFTGSSSIRLWSSLATDFPNKPVLNRGFGGSELSDVIRFADRLIVNYQPKQVVVYAGENDIASGKQTGKQTYKRFVTLFRYVRKKLPDVPFTFIAIKPSPSRRKYFAEVDEANKLIQRFLARKSNTSFVDIRPTMLQPNGQPIPELFRSDSLHMTEKGYQRWTQVLAPYLK